VPITRLEGGEEKKKKENRKEDFRDSSSLYTASILYPTNGGRGEKGGKRGGRGERPAAIQRRGLLLLDVFARRTHCAVEGEKGEHERAAKDTTECAFGDAFL